MSPDHISWLLSLACRRALCTVHVLHGEGRSEGQNKRAEGLPGVVALPVVCGGRRCCWGAEGGRGGGASPFSSSPSSASFFFLPLPLLCSSLVLFFGLSLPSLLGPFFSFPFPCFYRQKQGRETSLGRPLCCRPSTVRPTRGKWLVSRRLLEGRRRLFEGWMAVTEEGRRIFFFPCFARPGEEEDGAISKRHRF